MARVTVEDCVDKVDDRFELVLLAAQRAKNIAAGSPLTIERQGEKNAVLALREMAMEKVSVDDLREDVVSSLQRFRQSEEEQMESDVVGTANPLELEEELEIIAQEAELPESETEEEIERLAANEAADDESLDVEENLNYSFGDEDNVDEA